MNYHLISNKNICLHTETLKLSKYIIYFSFSQQMKIHMWYTANVHQTN